jgi:hypothetical protein
VLTGFKVPTLCPKWLSRADRSRTSMWPSPVMSAVDKDEVVVLPKLDSRTDRSDTSTLLSLLRSPGRAGLGAARDFQIRMPTRPKTIAKRRSWGREKLYLNFRVGINA